MSKLSGLIFGAWLLAFGVAQANTVTTDRTEATLLAPIRTIHAGEKFWTVLHIRMQPGWHTYWKNPGDSGTTPSFKWTLPSGFSAGDIEYLGPERLSIGPLVDYGYGEDAYYPAAITAPPVLHENTTVILALKAQWLVCKDVCIPETGDLSLALPVSMKAEADPGPDATLVADLVAKLPTAVSQQLDFYVTEGAVHFEMKTKDIKGIKSALYFPAEEGLFANAAEQKAVIGDGAVLFTLKPAEGALPKKSSGLVSLFLDNNSRRDFEVSLRQGAAPVTSGDGNDWVQSALFAFLGGLILNLMPCVFPILSLKCLAVAKKAALHKTHVRAQGLAYTAGVVVSFLVLALLLVVTERVSGVAAGWGFQMQSPIFVAALAYLFFVVGLNLSGAFELPTLFGNVGSEATAQDSVMGAFLTGVLAVLVATPCTAPFMAPAIGFALTQALPVLLAVFTALGLGLAAPFLLISIFPQLVTLLPKPGAWMQTFKRFLAFPMYACCVWFIWVLTHEAGKDAAVVILAGMLCVSFGIWLWQRDSSLARFLALVIAVAGIAFSMTMIHPSSEPQEKLKNRAEKFLPERLQALRAEGKGVFVDATADWCITCKVNETVALSSSAVMHVFQEKHITYMVADWTRGDDAITQYLRSFGRSGVPIYVYYPAGGGEPVVLPQLLTESIVLKAVQ